MSTTTPQPSFWEKIVDIDVLCIVAEIIFGLGFYMVFRDNPIVGNIYITALGISIVAGITAVAGSYFRAKVGVADIQAGKTSASLPEASQTSVASALSDLSTVLPAGKWVMTVGTDGKINLAPST